MNVIYPRCCVLDVQQQTVVAGLRIHDRSPVHKEVRTFSALPSGLVELSDWLAAHGVTHVAIESTGKSWKPIYATLQPAFTVLLINAASATDSKDVGWIADLLAHGLVSSRIMPPDPVRKPTRYDRRKLVAVGAVMVVTLLTIGWLWRHSSRADSEHPSVQSPPRTVRWQQPQVSYQHPAGDQFTFPLPKLEYSPEGVPVEVTLDASGDRPSWLHFDRERLQIRGSAPITAEDKTYQLIFRAQTEHGGESRLALSLTIIGQPEPPPSSVSTDVLPSPPAPSESPPSARVFDKERVLKILKEEPSAAAAPLAELPPAPPAPKPLPSDRPRNKDCLLKTLKGEPCESGG